MIAQDYVTVKYKFIVYFRVIWWVDMTYHNMKINEITKRLCHVCLHMKSICSLKETAL